MHKYLLILSFLVLIDGQAQETINVKNFDIKKFKENNPDGLAKKYITDKETQIQEFISGQGYVRHVTPKNSLFTNYYEFYNSGDLKTRGVFYTRDFLIGIWEYHDENGQLIKTTDYDKPYKFAWEEVKKYCKVNGIDLYHNLTWIRRTFSPVLDEGFWTIEGIVKDKGYRQIRLDAKTGKKLSEIEMTIEK